MSKSQTKSQKSTSRSKRERAAKTIQAAFRLRNERKSILRKMQEDTTCPTEPIRIGDENVYMFTTRKDNELPLFNIFNFYNQSRGIQNEAFFKEFYNILSVAFEYKITPDTLLINLSYAFYVFKNAEGILNICMLDYEKYPAEYQKTLDEFFFPYVLYIFANSKIYLNEQQYTNVVFKIIILHPDSSDDVRVNIHRDNTYRTCLTYVDSPLSTELAFNTKKLRKLNLKWLICSPLFRFDTTDKFFTLCFNDEYMLHTIPLYEESGKQTEDINRFERGWSMQQSKDSGGVEYLDFYFDKKHDKSFLKPVHRTAVKRPEKKRKVITSFINVFEGQFPIETAFVKSFPVSVLQDYKMSYSEEKIELLKEHVISILSKPMLGRTMRMRGGGRATRKCK
jgi:hypothetical protein